MKNKDGKLRLGLVAFHLLAGSLDILLQLADGILEGGAGVVYLVDNEDALANEVLHVAERSQVEPLGAGHLGAGGLDVRVLTELLVEGEADGLDGDVGGAGLLEERAEDARRDVAATANGNHELGLELVEELLGRLLAQVVHLFAMGVSQVMSCVYWGSAVCGMGKRGGKHCCLSFPVLRQCETETETWMLHSSSSSFFFFYL